MVQTTHFDYLPDGTIDAEAWLSSLSTDKTIKQLNLIRQACTLSQLTGGQHPTYGGGSCLERGLEMADLLIQIGTDHEAIAAAIVYDAVQHADLPLDEVSEQLGARVAKLVQGTARMDAIQGVTKTGLLQHNHTQLDNIRKMLLAMVDDIRVVLIKLTEQTCLLRACEHLGQTEQLHLAKSIKNIYAPLANRLGIDTIKWEMEDRCFSYLSSKEYKSIAKMIATRRVDREHYVKDINEQLTTLLNNEKLAAHEIMGRPKHIFSIYNKMKRKEVNFDQIYDAFAFRVLVSSIEECYTVLSAVHSAWAQIPEEFDDYVANPKPNGYQSIHTAVIGPDNKNIEIQIRTFTMHEESELGVAAHWRYKEGSKTSNQEAKIAWLRQVLDWQRELASQGETIDPLDSEVFDDRVYAFTPKGDVIDLPPKATPIDFAYYIHSEVGNRCRGAKINGHIVPLTYSLKTGDQVDILTTKEGAPSRDWLNPNLGYVTTSRAKAKIHHVFREQDFDKNLKIGKQLLEDSLRRLEISINTVDLKPIATRYNFKTNDDLLASLGCGDIKMQQLLNLIQQQISPQREPELDIKKQSPAAKPDHAKGIRIHGVGNLLTIIAQCCQPVPGDDIIGYITQGRGVSVHTQDCPNILNATPSGQERLVSVEWGNDEALYSVNIVLHAYDRRNLLRDVTGILSNEHVNMTAFNIETQKNTHEVFFYMTWEVKDLASLGQLMDKMKLIQNVIDVKRKQHVD